MSDTYDVVVIGGGAAGLEGALMLARARRTVLVIDAGEPRNAPASGVHGFLSRDGLAPADLTAIGRDEVRRYGGEIVRAAVTDARRTGDGFTVSIARDREVRARRLLVTTGLVDELPDVPGIRERWGRDVLHCPYCHGWEISDQPVGVLATGPMSVHQALLFRQWTDDVVLFRHTAPAPTADELEQLQARGIRVVEGTVDRLEIVDDRLTGVRLTGGTVVARQALVVAPRFVARVDALTSLGLATELEPMSGGRFVPADGSGLTKVPGVWVAGNVTDIKAQVLGAAAGAALAATAINNDLITEDTQRAVAEHRARQQKGARQMTDLPEVLDQEFWDERYRSSQRLWSGNPNPNLVAEVAELAPATALDVGCGEGADAIWLARRGWTVHGIDLSSVAIERAAEHAAEHAADVAGRITWQAADLLAWDPGTARYDLVTSQYVHLPSGQREVLYAHLADLVAPGGTLLIVGHHPSDLDAGVPRPPRPELFFTPEEVVALLDPQEWTVDTAAATARTVTHHDHEVTIHDSVVRAHRAR